MFDPLNASKIFDNKFIYLFTVVHTTNLTVPHVLSKKKMNFYQNTLDEKK